MPDLLRDTILVALWLTAIASAIYTAMCEGWLP